LQANLEFLPFTGRFMRADALAHWNKDAARSDRGTKPGLN
jgi:hypothetical protein